MQQDLHLCAVALVLGSLVACSKSNDNTDGTAAGTGNGANVGGGYGTKSSGTGSNSATDPNAGGTSGSGTAGKLCGTAACGTVRCGKSLDDCGNQIDCGYANCSQSECGLKNAGYCSACVPTTCSALGKNCGPMPDGCGAFLECGTCTAPECCGCGGVDSVCGGSSTGTTASVTNTCVVGNKGCLCDSAGKCKSELTCSAQANSLNLCCNGADCASDGVSIGTSCGAITTPATCTPGVTIPTASGSNDNCGYPESSFNESVILCGIAASGGGSIPAQIQAFYNDEHALALGCATNSSPVAGLSGSGVSSAFYPQTGDPKCVDTAGRPMRPVLFITDVTSDENCKAGDQQSGGKAYDPVAVFGKWKSATMASDNTGTPDRADPTPLNYWELGSAADKVPQAAADTCPCTSSNCNTSGHSGRGYGAEVRYEAGLISGHRYRLQVQMHDGDQTQGGDAGEACVIFCAGTGQACTAKTCADFPADTCGRQPDGCGGLTPECKHCCTATCEQLSECAPLSGASMVRCQTNQDASNGYILSCFKSDGCGGRLPCWCPVG